MEIILSDRMLYSSKFDGQKIEVVYRYSYLADKSGIFTKVGGI